MPQSVRMTNIDHLHEYRRLQWKSIVMLATQLLSSVQQGHPSCTEPWVTESWTPQLEENSLQWIWQRANQFWGRDLPNIAKSAICSDQPAPDWPSSEATVLRSCVGNHQKINNKGPIRNQSSIFAIVKVIPVNKDLTQSSLEASLPRYTHHHA